MNRQDQELIELYLKNRRKRKVIILIIVLIIFLSPLPYMFYLYIYNNDDNIDKIQSETNEIIEDITDTKEKKNEEIQSIPVEDETVVNEQQENIKKIEETGSNNMDTISKNDTVQKETEKPKNKDFLFTDGYNMDNVTEAAKSYLNSFDYSGECIPIQDDEGVYIGMRVIFY